MRSRSSTGTRNRFLVDAFLTKVTSVGRRSDLEWLVQQEADGKAWPIDPVPMTKLVQQGGDSDEARILLSAGYRPEVAMGLIEDYLAANETLESADLASGDQRLEQMTKLHDPLVDYVREYVRYWRSAVFAELT